MCSAIEGRTGPLGPETQGRGDLLDAPSYRPAGPVVSLLRLALAVCVVVAALRAAAAAAQRRLAVRLTAAPSSVSVAQAQASDRWLNALSIVLVATLAATTA